MTDLTGLRVSYTRAELSRADLNRDPLAQFQGWFARRRPRRCPNRTP